MHEHFGGGHRKNLLARNQLSQRLWNCELLRVQLLIDESIDAVPTRGSELIRLDEALDALAQLDPRKARVIELRFFSGLNAEESAEVLKISARSVMRDWSLARAWLLRELSH